MSSKVLTMKNRKIVLIANVKDAPFKCNICRKVFINGTYLTRHYERRHPKQTPTQTACIPKRKGYPDSNIKLSEIVGHHSINDVLNATQRIETLLSNLTINKVSTVPLGNELEINKTNVLPASCGDEARKSPHDFLLPVKSASLEIPMIAGLNITYDLPPADKDQLAVASKLPLTSGNELNESYKLPLANSTLNEIDSGSFETKNSYHDTVRREERIEVYSESSSFFVSHRTNNGDRTKSKESEENSIVKELYEIGEKSYYDCLVAEEKNVLERIMSPKQEINILENLKQNITSNISTGSGTSKISCEEVSSESSYSDEHETLGDIHKRLRLNTKSVLDSKLHLYGVDPNCQGISDEAACNIRKMLISQREECNSEYNRLRDLINHNADSRIKMSIES